jgi:diadenosine tetraphosphate (Ap4A) HIT family hydrolase
LKLVERKDRSCEFQECLAYLDNSIGAPKLFIAQVKGIVAECIRGENHPQLWSRLGQIFVPENYEKTLSEMTEEEYSHWRNCIAESASKKFRDWYVDNHSIPIYQTKNFEVVVPYVPHITREDGGHLIIIPKRKVRDRQEFSQSEAHELIDLSIKLGDAMVKGLIARGIDVGRINYQDNGNWSVNDPSMHLHLYGRAKSAIVQPYGHALNFPLPDTGFYDNNIKLDNDDINEIKKYLL